MSEMINMLARSQSKELLVAHLFEAINIYMAEPSDDNYLKVTMSAALVALKESADMGRIQNLLERMALGCLPFTIVSAN